MTRGLRGPILFAALMGLLAVGAGVARLAMSGVIIARVFQGAPLPTLVLPLLAVAALTALRSLLQYLRDIVSYRTAARTKIELRRRLYQHALALGPGHFDQRRTGAVLTFLVDGVESLEAFFGQYLPQFIVATVAPVLIFGFMAFLDVWIGLIFLVFAAFTLFVPSLVQRRNRLRNLARRDAYAALGADFLDSVQGLPTLKAFGQSKERGKLLATRARDLFQSTMRVLAADGASGAAITLGISAGAAVALVWGATRVSSGDLELRTLIIVLMLGSEVFRPMRELAQLYHQGMVAMSAAEGIFALLDTPVAIREPSANAAGPNTENLTKVDGVAPEISFENVDFGYEGGRRPALKGLSFTLHAGETLGLVGASGAGKSTVVWLLLRFYDPQHGRITLGGHDLRELRLDTIRSQVSVVTQDTYLFNGTVAENLRLGKRDATREELEDAARAASAHEFISALPNGYETQIGERGVRLSGGERQRVSIARALLKSTPILVLDEALSSVDAENEAAIQEALERLMAGKTTLVIAHRLSSVAGADRILVLDQGRLAESGRHEQLAAAGGVYARLMASQRVMPEDDLLAATLPSSMRGDVGTDADRHMAAPTPEDGGDASVSTAGSALGSMEAWARLLALLKPWRGKLVLTLALGLVYHGATIGLGAASALLVARVFTGDGFSSLLLALGVLAPLAALSRWGESWVSHDVAFRLLAEMRIALYYKLEPLAPAYLVRRKSGDLAGIVGSDVELIEYFFAHVITPAVVAVVVPGAVLLALVFVSWPIALVLLPILVAAAVSPFLTQKRSERLAEVMRRELGEMSSSVVDGIQGMREILAFGAGQPQVEETVNRGREFGRHRTRFLEAEASNSSFIEALMAVGGLAVLATGAWLSVQGHMPRTHLPLATLLALSAFFPVAELSRTLKQLMETLAAARRVFDVHDEPVAVKDGPGVDGAAGEPYLQSPSIAFKGVSFSYSNRATPALESVTFGADLGQTVAIVGRSGAGKSTSANLLMRFWDPDTGSIELGGHDLRDFRLDELRRHVALVSQDTYLFNTTIRENLHIAKQVAGDGEIERAARLANAAEFIEALPDGYDTLVGERGMQLSGGQRQRVSIARALLKDAPVLILDEATSHLDAVNEQKVREALRRLMEGRTTLVIAHRLSTVRDADLIVVLDSGRVVEQGVHQTLLARGGLYSRLVQTQLVGASSQLGR